MKLIDSGYTEQEIDALLAPFMAKKQSFGDQNLLVAMRIGLLDGDVIETSDRGTVLLETPREELDRRVAAIKEKLAAGTPLDEALEAVVG
jgi:hypothetical protein